jgi:DNA ligase (NAD+)
MSNFQNLLALTNHLLSQIGSVDFSFWSRDQYDRIYIDLVDILIGHNKLYYQSSTPIISDETYDVLFSALRLIESRFPEIISPDSPTQSLAWQIQNDFVKAQHISPLLSLENSYNMQDIKDRYESITKMITKSDSYFAQQVLQQQSISFTCEPKYDGISIELIYRYGIFSQAITRGDGTIGEDVTTNVATLWSIPKTLKWCNQEIISIRWEIVMPKSVFINLNIKKTNIWETNFVNARNACSGSIKQLDPNITAQRGLMCYVYDILYGNTSDCTTNEKIIVQLKNRWFQLYPLFCVCKTIWDIVDLLSDSKFKLKLDQADIDFDGIVVKVNELYFRTILWDTNHHPRRAIAYKFPAKQVHTTLVRVEYQVGRLGTITPVAILDPIQLSGVTISKATLHNFDFIVQKDIRIWDQIIIQRSWEVIPYVVSVVSNCRTWKEISIKVPVFCPYCYTKLAHQDVYIICPNKYCKAKIKQQILHFVGRNAMNIEWFWESIVDMLVENNILAHRSDIYKLTDINLRTTLKSLPLIGDKKLNQLIANIEFSKNTDLRRIIHAVGIPNVGKKTALMLTIAVSEYAHNHVLPNIDVGRLVYILLTDNFLTSIFGLWQKSAEAIRFYLNDQENIKSLMMIQALWVNFNNIITPQSPQSDTTSNIYGIHFAISGTFDITRLQLIQLLVWKWAFYDETISRKTNLLIVGNKWSSKIKKAQQRGIMIVEDIDWLIDVYPELSWELKVYKKQLEEKLF